MNYKKYYMDQAGEEYNVYRGVVRQRGYGLGGIFKTMYRYIMPLFKAHALPVLKSGAKLVGTEAIRAASNIATDAIRGDNLKNVVKHHATNAVQNISDKAITKLQTGSGKKNKLINKRKNPFNNSHKKSFKKVKKVKDVFDNFKNERIKRRII